MNRRRDFVLLAAICFAAVTALSASASYQAFQQAESVWGEGCGATNAYLRFHATFDAAKGESPVLRIAAVTVYRAKLNGEFFCYGPARTAEGWAKVDEWQLADVREGRNEIEIDVAGYVCESYQYVIQPAFLRAEVVQGGRVLAATAQRRVKDNTARQGRRSVFAPARLPRRAVRRRPGREARHRSARESGGGQAASARSAVSRVQGKRRLLRDEGRAGQGLIGSVQRHGLHRLQGQGRGARHVCHSL